MPESSSPLRRASDGKRRCSADAIGNERFVPNYIRNSPFPYSKAYSLDYGEANVSLSSTTSQNGYYSYGRRDSLNRTRFLLVRTCFSNGKEAFRRVTLPGGSSLTELKKVVENSMRKGEIEAMWTLPDRVLVEEDSQIDQFSDCQKIDVKYKLAIPSTRPVGEGIIDSNAVKSVMNTELEVSEDKVVNTTIGSEDSFPVTLMEHSSEHESSDSINVVQVDSEQNVFLRRSVDSDRCDFVKV